MELAEIKRQITHLSEELRLNAIHEQHVIVGGKIVDIIPPFTKENSIYILRIDDVIGTINVLVSEVFMNEFKNQITLDEVLFFEGYANVVSRVIKQKVKKDVSVFAYSLKEISEGEKDEE
ncbi:hypothetical protein KC480_05765 [Bacillus velezensis]|uniref:hypothetical protein n=1 Tax=Bacillus velezensis TaxID=492670 RepID=UPI001E6397B5|nr:hypothetical protein [Bacillus velezensis]MCD7911031.1 hypothetical protein [Bacillus velezensis]